MRLLALQAISKIAKSAYKMLSEEYLTLHAKNMLRHDLDVKTELAETTKALDMWCLFIHDDLRMIKMVDEWTIHSNWRLMSDDPRRS